MGEGPMGKILYLPRFGMILTLKLNYWVELVMSELDFAKGGKIHVYIMDKDFYRGLL